MSKKRNLRLSLRISEEEKEIVMDNYKKEGYESLNDYLIKKSINVLNREKISTYKINTLTLNPAVDFILKIKDDLKSDVINRYNHSNKVFSPGGKGINVSLVANEFNILTNTIYFAGGFTGKFIENELNNLELRNKLIKSSITTRINIKLNFSNSEAYEINGSAPMINKISKFKILSEIKNIGLNEDLVISGSFNDKNNLLIDEIIEISKERKLKLTLDLPTKKLKNFITSNVFFIKPNLCELEMIMNKKLKNESEIISVMYLLQDMGASNVAVTLGKNGSLLLDENKNIYRATISPIKVVSPQGAGDSFVSAFLCNQEKGYKKAFLIANAAGAASASVEAVPNLELINKMIDLIKIKKIR